VNRRFLRLVPRRWDDFDSSPFAMRREAIFESAIAAAGYYEAEGEDLQDAILEGVRAQLESEEELAAAEACDERGAA
jgi:hypothetical protein